MSELTASIVRKDRRAVGTAKQMGAAAVAELEPLTGNKDAEVRELAMMCLDASGGPGVGGIFVKGLMDRDAMVEVASARGLNHHADPSDVPAMMAAYPRVEDGMIRGQLALAVGKTGKGLEELRVAYGLEKDESAREGCVVALTKLGDEAARVDFIARWFASKGPARGEWFDHAKYVIGEGGKGEPRWMLKPLLRFLDDVTPAYRIGVDARPDLPHYSRSCDEAVKLVALIMGKKFGFMEKGGPNYKGVELEEVRAYVRGLGV